MTKVLLGAEGGGRGYIVVKELGACIFLQKHELCVYFMQLGDLYHLLAILA